MSRSSSKKGDGGLRLLRVGESVRHALSSIIARGEIRDSDVEGVMVTVTEVDISPDLRNAKVYVMPMLVDANVAKRDSVIAGLNRTSGYIRGQLASEVRMKYLPKLKFVVDPSFDEASKIESLLRDPHVKQDTADDS